MKNENKHVNKKIPVKKKKPDDKKKPVDKKIPVDKKKPVKKKINKKQGGNPHIHQEPFQYYQEPFQYNQEPFQYYQEPFQYNQEPFQYYQELKPNYQPYHQPFQNVATDHRHMQVKLLSHGGYGCVINRSIYNVHPEILPAFYTLDKNTFMKQDLADMYITKISRDKSATYGEININIKLRKEYKKDYHNSFLPIFKKYAIYSANQERQLNIPVLSNCLTKISGRDSNLIGEIVYEKAGMDLSFKFVRNFDYYFDLLIDFFINLKDFHEKGFVHRDIKINNILFNEKKNKFILIDFGTTYHKTDVREGIFFENSNIDQFPNNPLVWPNCGLEYLLLNNNPRKRNLGNRLIQWTRHDIPRIEMYYLEYLKDQLRFLNNFDKNTIKDYFYATDYYACGIFMNTISKQILFTQFDIQINDHIVYILTLINPKIRTDAFNEMLIILKTYKKHKDKDKLLIELKKIFNNNYLKQQHYEQNIPIVKSPIIKSKQLDQHQTKKKDIAIQTEPEDYNYNGANLKYLPKTYKIKSNLKQLYEDFKFVFGKKK